MKSILRSPWEPIRMGIKVKVILEHDLKFELLLKNIFNKSINIVSFTILRIC